VRSRVSSFKWEYSNFLPSFPFHLFCTSLIWNAVYCSVDRTSWYIPTIWTNSMHGLLSITSIINLYMLRAGLLLIIRRYCSLYTCVYVDWLLAGSCQQPVKINAWHMIYSYLLTAIGLTPGGNSRYKFTHK
jgi:hypothetical protein